MEDEIDTGIFGSVEYVHTFFAHGYPRRWIVFSGGWIQFYWHTSYICERSPVRNKRSFRRHKKDRVVMSKTVKVEDDD